MKMARQGLEEVLDKKPKINKKTIWMFETFLT
jgi:hypothetical protein